MTEELKQKTLIVNQNIKEHLKLLNKKITLLEDCNDSYYNIRGNVNSITSKTKSDLVNLVGEECLIN